MQQQMSELDTLKQFTSNGEVTINLITVNGRNPLTIEVDIKVNEDGDEVLSYHNPATGNITTAKVSTDAESDNTIGNFLQDIECIVVAGDANFAHKVDQLLDAREKLGEEDLELVVANIASAIFQFTDRNLAISHLQWAKSGEIMYALVQVPEMAKDEIASKIESSFVNMEKVASAAPVGGESELDAFARRAYGSNNLTNKTVH